MTKWEKPKTYRTLSNGVLLAKAIKINCVNCRNIPSGQSAAKPLQGKVQRLSDRSRVK